MGAQLQDAVPPAVQLVRCADTSAVSYSKTRGLRLLGTRLHRSRPCPWSLDASRGAGEMCYDNKVTSLCCTATAMWPLAGTHRPTPPEFIKF